MSTLDPNSTDVLAEPVVIADDRPCLRCGYNLRGLSDRGVCPECGSPVLDSLRGNMLAYSSPEYVGRLALGARLVWWSIALILLSIIGTVVLGVAIPGPGWMYLMPLVQTASGALGLAGWWLLSTPDPAAQQDKDARARKVLRGAVVVSAACFVVNTIVGFSVGAPGRGFLGLGGGSPRSAGQAVSFAAILFATIAGLVAQLSWFVQFFASMLDLRALAPRIPDPAIASRTRVLMWFAMLMGGMLLLIIPLAVFAAVSDASEAIFVIAVPACVFGIAALVAFVMYIVLIDRLKRKLVEIVRAAPGSA